MRIHSHLIRRIRATCNKRRPVFPYSYNQVSDSRSGAHAPMRDKYREGRMHMANKHPRSPLAFSAKAASAFALAVSILPLGAMSAVAQSQSISEQLQEASA